MNKLIYRIDQEVDKRSLLKHPFYKMWSNGELSIDDLQGYSLEYFQLVKMVPEMVNNILLKMGESKLRGLVEESQKEEKNHVEPWIRFASSLGVKKKDLLNHVCDENTKEAVSSLVELSKNSLDEAICAMYAYELDLPNISRSKIEGLSKFYNLSSPDSRNYFEIHQEADIRHAAIWRNMIRKIPDHKYESCINSAIDSLNAQNLLLDAVYEKYVKSFN
ncbi:MAG TPA: iron-containing redox enzyme family protein [Nitrososphaeraceae archaeon]|jgi:pyrroloquinoline-quinone synthase|nr:iron-containing redox enzyme family protein [Nitrososphaeraceae archaeon]